ncbi:hypothetical protein HO406_00220 [Streptococcus suis]|nr:hypothetical protein [Streptococcus suis]
MIDSDITKGRIILYTEKDLKDLEVLNVFREKVRENKILYNAGDLGEVYAISLAQTLGACSLLTNDTKQGGPYMSLLQFNDEVMPFNFTDILILRYLFDGVDEIQTVTDFNKINESSNLNISFISQLKKFIKRFLTNPYNNNDKEWIEKLISKNQINNLKEKFQVLKKAIESAN